MKKILVVLLLMASILVVSCGNNDSKTGYATYQGQGPPPQQQYVGGGCGVAPAGNYADNPASSFEKSSAA